MSEACSLEGLDCIQCSGGEKVPFLLCSYIWEARDPRCALQYFTRFSPEHYATRYDSGLHDISHALAFLHLEHLWRMPRRTQFGLAVCLAVSFLAKSKLPGVAGASSAVCTGAPLQRYRDGDTGRTFAVSFLFPLCPTLHKYKCSILNY